MRHGQQGTVAIAVLVGLVGTSGCGYTSQYSAPVDGRPRAVWRNDKVVVQSAGVARTPECAEAVAELSGNARPAPPPPPSGYYTPQWYGPPLVVLTPGFAPPLPRPPLFFSPSLTIATALAHGGPKGGGGLRLDGGAAGRGVRGGSGDTKGLEAAVLYMAVVALLVLPIVDTTLALVPAESVTESVAAIDEVNAWNDLLRWPGSPCGPPAVPQGAP